MYDAMTELDMPGSGRANQGGGGYTHEYAYMGQIAQNGEKPQIQRTLGQSDALVKLKPSTTMWSL